MTWQRVVVIGLFTAGAIVSGMMGQVALAGYFAGTAATLAIPAHDRKPELGGKPNGNV